MDLRRERTHIERKGFQWVQDNVGEAVLWLEFDAHNSAMHPVYDEPMEGAGRAWKPPVLVPAQYVNESEAPRDSTEDARLQTNAIRLAVPFVYMVRSGISEPQDNVRHLNDMLVYRRNFWSINRYDIRGRLRSPIMVSVTATQIRVDDDMAFDDLPDIDGLLTTVKPLGFPSDTFTTQTFNHHELPAHHE